MDEHDCEEIQVVELQENIAGADERTCDELEMERKENGKERTNITARSYKSWSYRRTRTVLMNEPVMDLKLEGIRMERSG